MCHEAVVRDMGHHTPSYSGPQKAEPQGQYQWALLPSGFQWDSANGRLQPKEGSEGRRRVRLSIYLFSQLPSCRVSGSGSISLLK